MIYLDNAATTAYKPPAVTGAVLSALKYVSFNPGRGGHDGATRAAALVSDTRDKCARYFNCPNSDLVIFTHNCTDALNTALNGGAADGHVIITANEHNSVLRPLFELERRKIARITVIAPGADGAVTPGMIRDNIRSDTRLVCVNHVGNVTGAVAPVEEIGKITRSRGILFLVDAAQSAGHYPIDMEAMNIDLLAAAGHKGLHGPQGVGALLMSERAVVRPTRFGGTGTDSQSVYHPSSPPEAFEAGTLATPAIAGLNGALRWTERHEAKNRKTVENLSEIILKELAKIPNVTSYTPPGCGSGVISFNIAGLSSADTCDILNREYGICARGGLHCAPLIHRHLGTLETGGAARVSLAAQNTESEIEFFLRAAAEIAAD